MPHGCYFPIKNCFCWWISPISWSISLFVSLNVREHLSRHIMNCVMSRVDLVSCFTPSFNSNCNGDESLMVYQSGTTLAYISIANGHWQKMWDTVSMFLLHIMQRFTNSHPLRVRLSIVNILLLHISQPKTLTLGGANIFQTACTSESILGVCFIALYADLTVYWPVCDHRHRTSSCWFGTRATWLSLCCKIVNSCDASTVRVGLKVDLSDCEVRASCTVA